MPISSIGKQLLSTAFFALLLLWSIAVSPVGWFAWLGHRLTGKEGFRRLARTAGWLYGRSSLLLLRPFIKVRTLNAGEAVGIAPCIITVNHLSILDLYLVCFQDNRQICPVTRSWPFRILLPFTACMRTAGYVEAEGRDAGAVIEECRSRLSDGVALVFFPEGHRSRTGNLGAFHSGAFRLALEESVPVVPMIIRNSFNVIQPGSFMVQPGTVDIEMLPAVMPDQYDAFRREPIPHRALMKYVRGLYVKYI